MLRFGSNVEVEREELREQVVVLLACFRHLALPEGELRDAAPKLLRYRLLHLPARLTRGQRKRWLHLRADWPWTDDPINT
ncbi:MAG TPA: hypothetical protein VJT72_09025 [Pseudonocardiaceae bacterium]|nr:hypothetical protein [Pseudonocardiaceae bacterium]